MFKVQIAKILLCGNPHISAAHSFPFPSFTIPLTLHSIWGGHYRNVKKRFHYIHIKQQSYRTKNLCKISKNFNLLLSSSQHPFSEHAQLVGKKLYSATITESSQLPHTQLLQQNCFNNSAWSDGHCPHTVNITCRGVTGTARMLHALTHSSISRQVREQM